MKKIYFVAALAGALGMVACSDNSIEENATEQSKVIRELSVVADAFTMDHSTRSSVNSSLEFKWTKSDKIGVWPTMDDDPTTDASQVVFTSTGATQTATFTGSGWGLLPDHTYYAYFPYSATASAREVKGSYTESLTQSSNNNTAHLSKNDFMYSECAIPAKGNTAKFQFHHFGSIMKVVVAVPEAYATTTFAKTTIMLADSILTKSFTYNPTAKEPETVAVTRTDRQVLTTKFTPVEGVLNLWFLVDEVDLSGKTINITVQTSSKTLTGQFTGANQVRGKAHKYDVSVVE